MGRVARGESGVRPLFLIYSRLGDAFRGDADVNSGDANHNPQGAA